MPAPEPLAETEPFVIVTKLHKLVCPELIPAAREVPAAARDPSEAAWRVTFEPDEHSIRHLPLDQEPKTFEPTITS
jgi:hypothetical protein